jgi:hypothetical protein
MAAPNARLYPLRYHPVQAAYERSTAKYNVVPAGRRSGKTEKAKRKVIKHLFTPTRWTDPRYFCAAPTRDQARQIYWDDLKKMIPERLRTETSETYMMIRTIMGSEVFVIGMDKPQRIEGRPWNGGILDEYADMKKGAWGENVQPALADRDGWCDLIGVPEGRNHYYDTYQYARDSGDPEWAAFTWLSSDILPAKVIERAKRSLDPLVYQQEYEASFVNFLGRIYYPFLAATHTSAKLTYDPRRPLILCFDFNVEPGIACVCQEQPLPGQFERDDNGIQLLNRPLWGTGVIGEVWIPKNSNTPAVCRKLLTDWGRHQGAVLVYGDAAGGSRGTAQTEGSDWDLIKRFLRDGMRDGGDLLPGFGDRVHFNVPAANPAVRARINAVNTRLQTSDGQIRLMVNPNTAPHVVRDLEGVTALAGGAGEIDKKGNPEMTHISDALGYYIEREFPIYSNEVGVAALEGY